MFSSYFRPKSYISLLVISIIISIPISMIFSSQDEIKESHSLRLYNGSKIEENMAIPIVFNFSNLTRNLNSTDNINIVWKQFNFSFTIDFGDEYHFHIIKINTSGYFGRIIRLDLELDEFLTISGTYNLTQTIIWNDEEHSPEFYYKESLKLNSYPNVTSTFDSKENKFTITELGKNDTIESELVVDTIRGVTEVIKIFNSSSSLKGSFKCDSIQLIFAPYPSKDYDGISMKQVVLTILCGILIISFSLLIINQIKKNKIK